MNPNLALLQRRVAAFNQRPGPRVGDYLRLPDLHPKLGRITRFTHDWGDKIQTGGLSGSYFFYHSGHLDYSGGLDPGVPATDILPAPVGGKPGSVWFFDGDITGPGRGVYFWAEMRVFQLRPGAKLDGLGELRCPFHLTVLDAESHARSCNYWYCISRRGVSETAFTTAEQLHAWLAAEGLQLTGPLTPTGTYSGQTLAYENTKPV